jgi:RNA polymerase sigma factor (sigma-70 family)
MAGGVRSSLNEGRHALRERFVSYREVPLSTCLQVLDVAGDQRPVDPSDEELVGRCTSGDEQAWKTLVQRYRRLVHAISMRAGLQPDSVDEIFQETFARLAERIGEIQQRERVRAWIVTTARHLTIDTIRAQATARRFQESVISFEELKPREAELPLEEIFQLEQQHLVRRALARLDSRSSRLLHLFFYDSDDKPCYAAIAKEIGMAVGSLGPTRARCLQKLRTEYEKLVGGEPTSELPISRCA